MPTIIRGFVEVGGLGKWTDLVNWRMLSIVFSFLGFANSYYTIRYEGNVFWNVISKTKDFIAKIENIKCTNLQ